MARLREKAYYQQLGLLTVDKLTRPRLIAALRLNLPLESIYHFFDDNGAVLGPDPNDALIRAVVGTGSPRVFVEHVTHLLGAEGSPRRTPVNPLILESDYRRKYRQFRPLRQDKALLINNQNLLVENYNMLNPLYRYIASYKAGYSRWKNNATTFWNNLKATHARFNWNQYIDLTLPNALPKYSDFTLMQNGGVTQQSTKAFNTATLLNLFDLFVWLGESRASSTLGSLTDAELDKTNLILRAKTHFCVLNLGRLNAWRRDPLLKNPGLDPVAIQRKFYILIQGLVEFNNGLLPLEEADSEGERHLEIRDPESAVPVAPTPAAPVAVEAPEVEGEAQDEDELAPESTTPQGQDALPDFDLGLSYEAPPAPVEVDATLELDDDDNELVVDAAEDEAQDQNYVQSAEKTQNDRLVQGIVNRAWEMSELNLISPAGYRRATEDAQAYTRLPDPFGSGQTLAEAMTYAPDDLELPPEATFPDNGTVPDTSMLTSSLKGIQRKYVSKLMQKDLLNAVMSVQQQGVAVVGYTVETVEDEMNHYQIHAVTLKPLRGRQTTVRFRVPVVDRDGRFVSNGVTYRMRWQRGDQPIRKVAPSRVALTSYYNKTFVMRSERVINDYDKWLLRTINERAMDEADSTITQARYSNGISSEFKLPRLYTLLAKRFRGFTAGEFQFFFDWANRAEFFEPLVGERFDEVQGLYTPIGVRGKQVIYIDGNGTLYTGKDGVNLDVLGSMLDLLGIDATGAPVEAAHMSVSNKTLPVGFVLGYQFGLTKLIESLGAEMSRHQRGERLNLGPDDYALVFQDEVRVFSKLDYRATLVLSGLNLYHRTLRRFSVYDFDKKDVYFRILEEAELGVRYLREIDTLFQAWIDPITLGLLEAMGEPTTFGPLIVRACEMIMDDYAPSEVDPAFMRYRGYERFSGVVFNELTRAVKTFNNRGGAGDQGVEMKQHEIWQRIVQDPSVALVEDSNPIANMREQEAMTYRGDGGRGGKSMVERTRLYHENDLGTISESTVDSGDVGVIAYMTADPNFTNMRGYTRPFDKSKDPKSKLFSSAALLAPLADHDDSKRINFIPIQQQQGIYCDGNEPTPVRTGYEQVVAQRTTGLFASAAEQDGEVVSVNSRALTVRYADGSELRLPLGLNHGTATGVVYPHLLTTQLTAGTAFKRGDTLTYNSKYFTPDRLTPNQVVWKAGVMANTVLIDDVDTLEDGSTISEELAAKLNTQTADPKVVTVGFEQYVHDLVKVGDRVELDSILCTIADPETANQSIFGETALDTLQRLRDKSPRAGVVGTVSRIDCYYHGDFEDLSENLQQLAQASNRERKARAKALGKKPTTGEVDTSFRVKGKALDPDTFAIKIYIDHDISAGVGDKGVFGNQMKTVFSRVMTGVNETESGMRLDAKFGRLSIEARMVHSPVLTGKANMLLSVGSKHIAAVYFGTAEPLYRDTP